MSDVVDVVVDAAVHPVVEHAGDLARYMREPYRQFLFLGPTRFLYPVPTMDGIGGAYVEEARTDSGLPGSDPAVFRARLDRTGVDRAVLVPLTRGLNPNLDLGSEICRATNDWLAETWLGEWNSDGRFFGSIRVNPADPDAAVDEIERWAADDRMVQVAVPLESHAPYGQRRFFGVWEAAARNSLPVAVHSDGGGGSDYFPTANGYPGYYVEYDSLVSLNFVYHLSSLIAEGAFERLPMLRFVFGDGGQDLAMTFMWRMDGEWPTSRMETPWVRRAPSDYMAEHVRFLTSRLEGPPDDEAVAEWPLISRSRDLLMFGSHFPHWRAMTPADLEPGLADADRGPVLAENAARFLRFPARA